MKTTSKRVIFNFYQSDEKGVSVDIQGSGNKAKAEKIIDEFKIDQKKSHKENAKSFADFIKNRSDIELLEEAEEREYAWRIEAKIEDDGTSKQG